MLFAKANKLYKYRYLNQQVFGNSLFTREPGKIILYTVTRMLQRRMHLQANK